MRSEVRLSLIYCVAGCLWIFGSDLLLFTQPESTQFIPSSIKGFLFVCVSSILLYFVLRREFRRREWLSQQAAAAEMDFRYLFMNSPLPMWVYDLDTLKFLDVNKATVAHYGYSRAEFLKMRATDIRPEEDVPDFLKHVERVKQSSQSTAEWRHLRKDGQVMNIEILAHRFVDREYKAVLVIAHDITEQKQARIAQVEQDQLRLALNKEIEMRSVRHRFISMVSHEFRSPLASMSTALDLLDHYLDRMSPEKRRERIASIRSQISELTHLLDEVLVLMKADTVGMEYQPETVELIGLCKGILEQTRQNDTADHVFSFSSTVDECLITADSKLLRYALRNLISNAVKYSPPRTTIFVDMDCKKEEVQVRVVDQGIGIPEAEQKRVFETFFRGTNTTDIPGTGLGLAIAKQAIDQHDGTFELQSEVGIGSTFTLKLPLRTPELQVTS